MTKDSSINLQTTCFREGEEMKGDIESGSNN